MVSGCECHVKLHSVSPRENKKRFFVINIGDLNFILGDPLATEGRQKAT